MIDYIKMICMDLLKDMIGSAATPAANHLFWIDDENAAPLDKDHTDLSIHLTMQLLFLSQRACPDVQTTVLFLWGCIQQPNDHDYKKLACVMKYLIRDGEMSHRGSTIMSDVFRKTVKIFNIMSEIPYLPVTG
jgi:hypothetical protein